MEPHNENLIRMLKELVLLRQRDRSIREQSIKTMKIMFKLNPSLDVIFKQ